MKQQNNLNSINLEENAVGSMSSSSNNAFTNYTVYHQNNHINSANLLDIVQITDIHVDPYYVPGSSAECGEPLCCRATSGPVKGPGKAAGVWGDYVRENLIIIDNLMTFFFFCILISEIVIRQLTP